MGTLLYGILFLLTGFKGVESLQQQDPFSAAQPQHHRGRRRQQDHCDTGSKPGMTFFVLREVLHLQLQFLERPSQDVPSLHD